MRGLVFGHRGIDGAIFLAGVAVRGRFGHRLASRHRPGLPLSVMPLPPRHQVQAEAGDRARPPLGRLPGARSHGDDGDPLRSVHALLAAGAADVDAPLVDVQRLGGQRRDRVHQVEDVGELLADHRADLAHGIEGAGRGLQVHHREHLGFGVIAQRLPRLLDRDRGPARQLDLRGGGAHHGDQVGEDLAEHAGVDRHADVAVLQEGVERRLLAVGGRADRQQHVAFGVQDLGQHRHAVALDVVERRVVDRVGQRLAHRLARGRVEVGLPAGQVELQRGTHGDGEYGVCASAAQAAGAAST